MDDMTLWRAFRRVRIKEHRRFHEGGAPHGGRGYLLVLDCLQGGEGKTQRELADLVEIRAQSLSEILAGMEEKGLIVRETDAEDRRAVRVFITDEGRRFRAERWEQIRLRAEELFRPLCEEEKQTLYQILEKLHAAQREEE